MARKVLKGGVFGSHKAEGTRLKGMTVWAAVQSGQDGPAGERALISGVRMAANLGVLSSC